MSPTPGGSARVKRPALNMVIGDKKMLQSRHAPASLDCCAYFQAVQQGCTLEIISYSLSTLFLDLTTFIKGVT